MKILEANSITASSSRIFSKITKNLQSRLTIPKVKVFDFKKFESAKQSIVSSVKNSMFYFNEKKFRDPLSLLDGIDIEPEIPQTCCIFELLKASPKSRLKQFREQSKVIESGIHEIYKAYRKNPESHPKYIDEWRRFYLLEYPKVLCTEINVSSKSFVPIWTRYWLHRMEELHYQDINAKNAQALAELNLTADQLRNYQEQKILKIIDRRKFVPNDSDRFMEPCMRDLKSPRRKRPQRCILDELHSKSNAEILDAKNYKFDAPGTVFSVCRQILAFEEELSVFLDAIRKVYIKAAALEKKRYSSSEELLADEEILRLFSVVKEKLRNGLENKAIDSGKVRCAQRTAQQLNSMLFTVEYRNRRVSEEKRRKSNGESK